jgi:hypothetical protein
MTLGEFLHPLDKAGRTDQVLAVLLFHKAYAEEAEMSAVDVRTALVQARVRGAKGMNVHQALARSERYAHQAKKGGAWTITESGERHLGDRYGITTMLPGNKSQTDVSALRDLALRVSDEATRGYISEAIECLQAGAHRAAVVFLWSGAIATIRKSVWDTVPAALRLRYSGTTRR